MLEHVSLQIFTPKGGELTITTMKRLCFSSMVEHVHLQTIGSTSFVIALITIESDLTSVLQHVRLQISRIIKRRLTLSAAEWFFPCMCSQMYLQQAGPVTLKTAFITVV